MANFTHASFISYRHGQGQIKQRFMQEFEEALRGELELLRSEEVFVDRERLKGGDFYDQMLQRAVYESATMIMIYQPNYFEERHAYCAREYRGMRALEELRLAQLPKPEDRLHGLIVPVVLRGADSIPPELRAMRQFEDFSKFMLLDEELSKHPHYSPKIKAIAEYIHARCQALEEADVAFDGGGGFVLPNEETTQQWIRELKLPKTRFPGEGGA